jgi:hypothetical protein
MHTQVIHHLLSLFLIKSYSLEIGTMQQGIFSYCWVQNDNNIADKKYGSISQDMFGIV